ncbi:hypothetical protein [Idiomarina sp. HP20-50]|uniref:hypothetical protein n=1 Tax=Idiomarina sp. HP20-50 TaxID=3070813 RepID=UPI00294AE376|nr:hypothetical protein [Idiomarina sp. HP20-50]MDV6315330.1 hypothetical protein [Idiomarina sp. HP20-50]
MRKFYRLALLLGVVVFLIVILYRTVSPLEMDEIHKDEAEVVASVDNKETYFKKVEDEKPSGITKLGSVEPARYSSYSMDSPISEPDANSKNNSLSVNRIIDELSAAGGLSEKAVEKAFRLRDFDALIYQLENTSSNQQFERDFRSLVRGIAETNAEVFQRSLGCSNKICAAVFEYSANKFPERFSQKLIDDLDGPISVMMQPVEVHGVTELRVLLNYNNARLVVE